MLASEAATASCTSSVTRCWSSIPRHSNAGRQPGLRPARGIMGFPIDIQMMAASSTIRIEQVAEANFPTEYGVFRIFGFRTSGAEPEEAVVLSMGDITTPEPLLVRIHSQCLTGDVFHSLRCDCRAQLEIALEQISAEKAGAADLRAPGRPRDRPAEQTPRLRIAGSGRRYRGGQSSTRGLKPTCAIMNCRPPSSPPQSQVGSADVQQSGEDPRAGRSRRAWWSAFPRLSRLRTPATPTRRQSGTRWATCSGIPTAITSPVVPYCSAFWIAASATGAINWYPGAVGAGRHWRCPASAFLSHPPPPCSNRRRSPSLLRHTRASMRSASGCPRAAAARSVCA